MKHILKQAEPQEFIDWKAQENENWKPTYEKLQNPEKKILKRALIEEQGGLCCYCEGRLVEGDSHIEHFKPQEKFESEALEYSNMLCSCQQVIEKGEPRHCGNLKADWYDEALMISPLDPTCEDRLMYHYDGRIEAMNSNDDAACHTIQHTGLSINKLEAQRKQAIAPFIDEELSVEDMKSFVAGYLEPETDGYFSEFYTTIRQLFGEYLNA